MIRMDNDADFASTTTNVAPILFAVGLRRSFSYWLVSIKFLIGYSISHRSTSIVYEWERLADQLNSLWSTIFQIFR